MIHNNSVLGIVGEKISHTLSPRIHNFSAQFLKKNVNYEIFDMGESKLSGFLDAFAAKGGVGFNVTTPHKHAVAKLVGGHDLSSINTVYRKGDQWRGTSTDMVGLEAAIKRLEYSITDFTRFVFLGNGGVVRAFLDFAKKRFKVFPQVLIVRRSAARDQEFLQEYPIAPSQLLNWDLESLSSAIANARKDTLVLQASSAPLRGDDLSYFCPAMQTFRGAFVDLVYGKPSALLRVAYVKNIPAQDGLPMLIEQARASQEFWWGTSAPYNEIFKELQKRR